MSFLDNVANWFNQNKPRVLTGAGIFGFFAGAGLVGWGTYKAVPKVEEKKRELKVAKLPILELVKTAAPYYIPGALSMAMGTTCVIMGQSENERRNAAVAAALAIAQSSVTEYKEEIAQLGRKKQQDIQQDLHQRALDMAPVVKDETIIRTGRGETLCYDAVFGRYFYSERNYIEHALNKVERTAGNGFDDFIAVNDFFFELDLPPVEAGDILGLQPEMNGMVNLQFTSNLKDGTRPVLVISYEVRTRYN